MVLQLEQHHQVTLMVAMIAHHGDDRVALLVLPTIRPKVRGSEKLITSSRKISTQFVHVVGFSNGCAELALKKPPPLVPSSLMASWLATGPPVMVCCAPARVLTTWSCRWKFWIAPPAMSTIAREDRDRQQDAQRAADQVDPEVAELAGARAGEAAHQRDRHGHADRGGDEVLHGQAGHLHQVALGGFTGVGLPVGVGHEADRGVPGQRRGHRRGRIVQVQRQLALDQLEDEQEQDADRGEGQHAAGVGAPGLLGLRVGADQPVDDPLDAGVLLGAVDPVHVVAQRHMDGRQREDQ